MLEGQEVLTGAHERVLDRAGLRRLCAYDS